MVSSYFGGVNSKFIGRSPTLTALEPTDLINRIRTTINQIEITILNIGLEGMQKDIQPLI